MQTIISKAQFAKLCATPVALRFTSSAAAIVLSLGLGLSGAPLFAQDTTGEDAPEKEEPNVTIEVAAVEGQDFNGSALGQFLPVVVGGFGDLLFLNRSEIRDVFLYFDGNLSAINAPSAFGSQNLSLPTYTIDSQGQGYALTTTQGVATGFVGEDDPAEIISVVDAFSPGQVVNSGNFAKGARPIILNDQTAILLSDVGLANNGVATGDTRTFVLFADFLGEFDQPVAFVINDDTITSLNFAGQNALLASSSNLLSSANSAQTSNLLRVDISDGIDNPADQVGPNGNPQTSLTEGLLGGDLSFDGFTFSGDAIDGGTVFGGGASYDAREFSANATSTAFVLNNALVGIDGSNDPSLPGQLLVLDDKVILAISQNIRFGTPTSIGDVNFMGFNDVVLAANGDIFFTSSTTDLNGAPLGNEVGLWRIINPGQADQAIVPVLTAGDELFLPAAEIERLFVESAPPSATSVRIADFNTVQQSLTAPNQTDGRPRFLSVNSDGHVATIVRIETNFGSLDAIVAQDDNGVFNIVAYVGQQITVNGPDDTRIITSFRAQFGSNDLDGAGDLYNSDEQLGFIVTLDDLATEMEEFTSAVLRVSLNGLAPRPVFTEFLWNAGCGDDEFSTDCTVNGEDGTNWVNAEDTREVAENPPGFNSNMDSATINGVDVRISVVDVNIARLISDSKITVQNGRTLTLSAASNIDELAIESGTVESADTLTTRLTSVTGEGTIGGLETEFLEVNGALSVASDITVSNQLDWLSGTIAGSGTLNLLGEGIGARPVLNIGGSGRRLSSEIIISAGDVTFADEASFSIDTNGILRLTDGSTASLRDGSITGVGEFALERGSSFTATGIVTVAADTIVRNGQDASGPAQSAIAAGPNTRLRFDDLTFTRTAPGAIADDSFAQISIGADSTIFIGEDHTLTIDDQVRLAGEGTLQVDGTLNLSERGLFENMGTVEALASKIQGEGLFVNKGMLRLTDEASGTLPGVTVDFQFANIDGGVLSNNGRLTFQTERLREITSPIDLRALGFEQLGLNLGDAAEQMPDIGVLLEFGPDAQGNAAALPSSLDVVGDGSVFLIGDLEFAFDDPLTIRTDAILSANLAAEGLFELASVEDLANDIFVVKSGSTQGLTLSGRGGLIARNINLTGVSAWSTGEGAVADRAVLSNAFGDRKFDLDLFKTDETFEAGLIAANLDEGFFQKALLEEVTLDNVDLINTGVLDLRESVSIAQDATVRILNSGATRIGQDFANDGRVEIETRGAKSLIEVSGTYTEAPTINLVDNVEGRFAITATGAPVSIELFNQSTVASNSESTSALLDVGSDAKVWVEASNLLVAGVEEGEIDLLGNIRTEGEVQLLINGEQGMLTVIREGASATINEGGSINGVDENGSGLTRVEGDFFGAGRFMDEALTVRGLGARATFKSGIESDLLTVGENARFDAGIDSKLLSDAVTLKTLELSGELFVNSGTSQVSTFNSLAGSEATIKGDLNFGTMTVAGTLVNSQSMVRALTPDPFVLEGTFMTVADGGEATSDKLTVGLLAIEDGGKLDANDDVSFDRANIAGEFELEDLKALEAGSIRELSIAASGMVDLKGGGTLTSLQIDDGGRFVFNETLTIQSASTAIAGSIEALGELIFDGDLAIESTGRITGSNNGASGNLSAESITLDGLIKASRIETRNITLNSTNLPTITFAEPGSNDALFLKNPLIPIELFSPANLSATQISFVGGIFVNNGAVVVEDNPSPNQFSLIGSGYRGGVRSFISVAGDSRLLGSVFLDPGSVFVQDGDLTVSGFLRQARTAQKIVTGSLSVSGAVQPATSVALQPFTRTVAEVSEDTAEQHEIEGNVLVVENVAFDAVVWIGEEGLFQVNGNAVFDGVDVDGSLFVGGDATLNSASIAGAALIEGDLIADSLTVEGSLQFASGAIGNMTIGVGGQVLADDFTLASDFINLGTFQLGDIEGGPGEFTTEGVFLQGGVFSGTGTINGSLVQAAQEGGRAGDQLLFNPGFSPGILNITGDATFDEGVVLMEIGGLTPGIEHDQINVTGMLTFGPNAMLVVDLLETANGEIFLPETGDEIVLFTANDISPDDVEQINFSVIDTLPLGFAIVPDITTTQDGEILRVLRGFNGSLLSDLNGLDPAQAGVAGAIDFLSSAQSGVPSADLFQRAVDLQFADTTEQQAAGLTELGATTFAGLQATALTAGRYNMEFIKDRLSASAITNTARQSSRQGPAGAPIKASVGSVASGNRDFGAREFALAATSQINRSGAVSYGSQGGPSLRFLGAASVNFGRQDSRGGVIGFDQDGWSASLGAEFENASGRLLIGAAVTLGENDADLDGGLGDTSSESTGLGIYTVYDAGIVRMAAAYSFADLDLDSNRQVQGRTASSSSDGSLKSLHGHILAPLIDTDGATIGPKIAFEHHDLEIDGLTETGAGDFSLFMADLDRKASAVNLSAVVDIGFNLGDWEGALEIEPGYQLALAGDRFTARSVGFAIAPGTLFAAPLQPLMNDGFTLDLGFTLVSQRGVDLRVAYDGLFAQTGQEQHAVSAQATIAF